jgi:hypothetical protein
MVYKTYGWCFLFIISYLGVIISEDNSHQIDWQKRIKMQTKHTVCDKIFFKSKNISNKLELKLNNTVIDKALTYASETWILTKRERESKWTFLKGNYIEEF